MPDTLQERDGDSVFPFARERRDWKEKLWIFWKSLKREWNGIDGRSKKCELMKK